MTDIVLGQKLSDAGREYANVTIRTFQIPGGVHPPTLVAACARMAGTYLFRSFRLRLPEVQPGQAVLSAEADQNFPMLLQTTAGILGNLGIKVANAPPPPTDNAATKPMHEFLHTQRLLEPLFVPIQAHHGFTQRQAAQAAAIATAILIHHFAKHLDPNVAFGIAALGLVEGTKTSPDPVQLPGQTA